MKSCIVTRQQQWDSLTELEAAQIYVSLELILTAQIQMVKKKELDNKKEKFYQILFIS